MDLKLIVFCNDCNEVIGTIHWNPDNPVPESLLIATAHLHVSFHEHHLVSLLVD